MPYEDFRHRMPLKVRWAEVDRQGVVFNAHYLLYADVCITEYWRAIGMPYPEAFLASGFDLYARKATVDFRAAAVYDDQLEVCARICRIGASSLNFALEIFRCEQTAAPLAVIELVYVNVDAAARTARRVPDGWRDRIRDFEVHAPAQADAH
jgi:acyl-CoA thioester hydrolase